jgi:4-amino-4-deoxy-L-arabinose transferase-like glycosyltransferase
MTTPPDSAEARLRPADYLVLVIACAALFGTAAFSGRPLSVHEARLPQLAREMALGESDWLLPQSGGRPWLERPPLPHWFTAASMVLFRRTDAAWAARIPAALMGCAMVLTGAWMAARWFGRQVGLLCGAVLATTYELYQYATLAEDDIYLGAIAVACVAMFVKNEWTPDGRPAADGETHRSRSGIGGLLSESLGWRPAPTVLLFLSLGLTNLAKGPLVGAAPIVATLGLYLLWNRDARRIRHYAWLWGWLLVLVLTAAWPWWAQRHYPDVVDNWRFDYLGRVDGTGASAATARKWDEAPWYYFAMLPGALAPWTWATVVGLLATARRAWRTPGSPERFLWCWAWAGLIVLSLPARKHHHYLVPVVMPWGILAGLGLLPVGRLLLTGAGRRPAPRAWPGVLVFGLPVALALMLLRHRIPGGAPSAAVLGGTWLCCVWMFCHGLARGRAGWLVGSVVAGFIGCAGWVQIVVAGRDPATLAESSFFREVDRAVPRDEPVFVNADMGSLRFFGVQFQLRRPARLLHNLSFLRASDITSPEVFVVTQAKDQSVLQQIGEVRQIAQADSSRARQSPGQRLTLFRLTFAKDQPRYPKPAYVGVMEAMGREKGPWCGPDWQPARSR